MVVQKKGEAASVYLSQEWEGRPRTNKAATEQKDSCLFCNCPGSGGNGVEERGVGMGVMLISEHF